MKAQLSFLYRPRTDRFWQYVFGTAAIAAAGSITLVSLALIFSGHLGSEVDGPDISVGVLHFLGIVVFSPVVETAILLLVLRRVRLAGAGPGLAAAIAGLLWGGLHGLVFPMWFFGTVWSFFVFACAASAWQGKSQAHAFWAAALPHALINGAVFAVVALAAGA